MARPGRRHDKWIPSSCRASDLRAIAAGEVDGERHRGHSIALIGTPATDLYLDLRSLRVVERARGCVAQAGTGGLIVNTIREAKAGSGPIPLRTRTPFIVIGDFNAISGATLFVDALAYRHCRHRPAGPPRDPIGTAPR